MHWDKFWFRLQGGASSFRYLSKSSTFTLPGVDDSEGLRQTLEAMRIVGLNENEREAVLQTVACVLHLGNIVFTEDDDDAAIPADDSARRALSMASILMQVFSSFHLMSSNMMLVLPNLGAPKWMHCTHPSLLDNKSDFVAYTWVLLLRQTTYLCMLIINHNIKGFQQWHPMTFEDTFKRYILQILQILARAVSLLLHSGI